MYVFPQGLEALRKVKTKEETEHNEILFRGFMENHNYFGNIEITDEMMSLITQKGCFPYEYVTDQIFLLETKEFPERELFLSVLQSGRQIEEETYERGKLIWKLFKCRNLYDYNTIYGIVDTTLLTAIASCRFNMMYKNSKLNPMNYTSMSSYSRDLAFLHRKVILQVTF